MSCTKSVKCIKKFKLKRVNIDFNTDSDPMAKLRLVSCQDTRIRNRCFTAHVKYNVADNDGQIASTFKMCTDSLGEFEFSIPDFTRAICINLDVFAHEENPPCDECQCFGKCEDLPIKPVCAKACAVFGPIFA